MTNQTTTPINQTGQKTLIVPQENGNRRWLQLMAYVPDKEEYCNPRDAWRNKVYRCKYSHNTEEVVARLADCMEAKINDPELNLHYHILCDQVELKKGDPVLEELLTFAKWRLGGVI